MTILQQLKLLSSTGPNALQFSQNSTVNFDNFIGNAHQSNQTSFWERSTAHPAIKSQQEKL